MTYNFKRLFLVLFTLSIGALFLWTASMRPSILIIHSSPAKSDWVKNMNAGIRKVLTKRTFYHSYYHYMDLENKANNNYTDGVKQETLELINSLKPNFLILVDDRAQELIGKQYVNHENIQIVYCGVKGDPKEYGYDKAKNVTGIYVSLPVNVLDELLTFNIDEGDFDHEIHLTFLSDQSFNSQEDHDVIASYKKWSRVRLKKSFQVATFKEWQDKIRGIGGSHDVILLSNYQALLASQDSDQLVSSREVVRWTVENAKVPVIGLYGPFVQEGGHLSVTPSALEQGEKAAKIVENLIENDVYIHELIPQKSNHFLIYLRKAEGYKSYKIIVPAVYEAFARSMHHYYE